MRAQGGSDANGASNGAAAAPEPTEPPPPVDQVVFADEAIEVADLDLPTALDRLRLEHVEEDEAEDQGELQPRAFLGAADDGEGGDVEPVANASAVPQVPHDGPAPLPPAAVACTPKAWQQQNKPAFEDKDNLTADFKEFFGPFPKAKDTPWTPEHRQVLCCAVLLADVM